MRAHVGGGGGSTRPRALAMMGQVDMGMVGEYVMLEGGGEGKEEEGCGKEVEGVRGIVIAMARGK